MPLILAGTEPLESIYCSVNSFPRLVGSSVQGNPEASSGGDLAAAARAVLDETYRSELGELGGLWELRTGQGRTLTDVADIARAATMGAVDTVLVDIEAAVPGAVDDDSGALTFGPEGATTYGVVDEIARRVWLGGGRVMAVRKDDVPGQQDSAAILRYAA